MHANDQQTDRWLVQLRDGSPPQKAEARRQLATIFAANGLPAEAIDMLVANARERFADAEQFQTLAGLYRAVGNEYLAASAAMEAAHLHGSGQQAPPRSPAPFSGPQPTRPLPPSYQRGLSPPPPRRDSTPGSPQRSPADQRPAWSRTRWRRPLRIAGWVAVACTIAAAAIVSTSRPASGVLYALAAGALGLMLAGATGLRRTARLPTGPLGDGLLLYVAVLMFLMAGALLPRPVATSPSPFATAPPTWTPGPLYVGTPTPPLQPAPTTIRPAQAAIAATQPAPVSPPSDPPGAADTRPVGSGPTSEDAGRSYAVTNAGNEGVRLRAGPGSEDVLKVLPDGATVVALGEERDHDGRSWRRVRTPDGSDGWIAVDFLVAVLPTPAQTAAGAPTPRSGAATATPRVAPVAATPPPAPKLPATGRAAPSGSACPDSHPIKGNHSSSGERIYHTPRGAFYTRTNPEECFASEAAARAAGYRASQR